jgi:hypothetical protein
MAADKKDYQSVLGALVDHANLPSIINKLNKVSIATEDVPLRKAIQSVVRHLEEQWRDTPSSQKSAKGSLRPHLAKEPYKSTVEYCQRCIDSTKPQWQIIAERHGWGPKAQ